MHRLRERNTNTIFEPLENHSNMYICKAFTVKVTAADIRALMSNRK